MNSLIWKFKNHKQLRIYLVHKALKIDYHNTAIYIACATGLAYITLTRTFLQQLHYAHSLVSPHEKRSGNKINLHFYESS